MLMQFLQQSGEHPALGVIFALLASVDIIAVAACVMYSIVGPALANGGGDDGDGPAGGGVGRTA